MCVFVVIQKPYKRLNHSQDVGSSCWDEQLVSVWFVTVKTRLIAGFPQRSTLSCRFNPQLQVTLQPSLILLWNSLAAQNNAYSLFTTADRGRHLSSQVAASNVDIYLKNTDTFSIYFAMCLNPRYIQKRPVLICCWLIMSEQADVRLCFHSRKWEEEFSFQLKVFTQFCSSASTELWLYCLVFLRYPSQLCLERINHFRKSSDFVEEIKGNRNV